jgi:hypothetical protein
MTSRALTALGIAGGLAVIGAGVAYSVQRRRSGSGSLGRALSRGVRVVEVVERNGRKLTHFRGPITIEDRLKIIEHMVMKSSKDPGIHAVAKQITRHCKSRDQLCELRAIHDHVVGNVRYTGDVAPVDLEGDGKREPVDVYQSADFTLNVAKAGDCDDHTITVRSLATVLGIPNHNRATSYLTALSPYSHIYGVGEVGGRKVAVDTTLERPQLGREIPFTRVLDYPR